MNIATSLGKGKVAQSKQKLYPLKWFSKGESNPQSAESHNTQLG